MKIVLALRCLALLLTISTARAQVLQCADQGLSATGDARMHRAAEYLRSAYPTVAFQDDPSPCVHARQTAKALASTIGTNPWQALVGFEYFKVVHGNAYFTVERLVFRNPRELQALAEALQTRRSHKLAIKANTVYKSMAAGSSLMLMISSAAGREKSTEMFDRIRPLLNE